VSKDLKAKQKFKDVILSI